MSDWFQLDKEYMMPTYCRTKVAIERGEGCKLYDVDGKEYVDLFSGVGVNVLGYNHPKLCKRQWSKLRNRCIYRFIFKPSCD